MFQRGLFGDSMGVYQANDDYLHYSNNDNADFFSTMPLSQGQQATLAVVPKITGWLSVIGSSTIAYFLLVRDPSKRKKVYHRLILGMAIADISSSVWLSLSTWPIPASSGVLWAVGTTKTCTAQGFFTQLGISSPLYNVSLSLYYVLAVRCNWKEPKLRKIEPFFHLGPWMWALGTGITGLPLRIFNNANLWCWIADHPERNTNTNPYRWAFFYGPLWTTLIVVTVNLFLLFRYVQRITRKSEEYIFQQQMKHRQQQHQQQISSNQPASTNSNTNANATIQPQLQQQQQQRSEHSTTDTVNDSNCKKEESSTKDDQYKHAKAMVAGSEEDHSHRETVSEVQDERNETEEGDDDKFEDYDGYDEDDEEEEDLNDDDDDFYYDQGFVTRPTQQELRIRSTRKQLRQQQQEQEHLREGEEDNRKSQQQQQSDGQTNGDTAAELNDAGSMRPSNASSARRSSFYNSASSRFSSLFLLGAPPSRRPSATSGHNASNARRPSERKRQRQERKEQRKLERMTQFAKRRRQVALQCLRYCVAFYWTWIPISAIRVIQTTGKPYDPSSAGIFLLFFLAAMNTPFQGLPNFIVYLYPMVLKAKQTLEEQQQPDRRERQQRRRQQTGERRGDSNASSGEIPDTKSNLFQWIRLSLSPSQAIAAAAATSGGTPQSDIERAQD
mmetsp:Transcript_17893/g.32260  ORF Transcript_17893/g.32260 Transcript_17893/m.32260 type:complete len:670 (+) Transcript_17893:74-2083(+)